MLHTGYTAAASATQKVIVNHADAVLSHATPRCAVLAYAGLGYAVPCCAVLCSALLC